MTIRLTRRYRFSASHRLNDRDLTQAQNRALYGKCNNPYGHGHNYVLEVSVAGAIDGATGQVARVEKLDRLVREQVVNTLDHRSLNQDVAPLRDIIPTTENLVLAIERMLLRAWSETFPAGGPRLAGVRLLETRKNHFELRT